MRSSEKYKDKEIWELNYQSTSDEGDSESAGSEESSEDSDDSEEKKQYESNNEEIKIGKHSFQQTGDKVPEVAKRIKRDKFMRGKKKT